MLSYFILSAIKTVKYVVHFLLFILLGIRNIALQLKYCLSYKYNISNAWGTTCFRGTELSLQIICLSLLFFFVQEAQTYADENGLLFMETSAKTALNVNETFLAIGIQTLLPTRRHL